jgi:PAS domain S-box-containing protein
LYLAPLGGKGIGVRWERTGSGPEANRWPALLRRVALHGIGARLLLRVVLFSSVLTSLLTALELYLDYRHGTSDLTRQVQQMARSHAPSLGDGMWYVDRRQLQGQAEGLAALPGILAVDIRELGPGEPGPLVAAAGSSLATAAEVFSFPISCTCDSAGRVLGILRVGVTHAGIIDQLLSRVLVIALGLGAKTLLVSVFTLLVVERLITRRLSRIAGALACYDPSTGIETLPVPEKPAAIADELDQVVVTFHDMEARLHRAHQRTREVTAALEHREAELAASERRLRALLATLPVGVFEDDVRHGITLASDLWQSLSGLTPAELRGNGWLRAVHPEDLAAVTETWLAAIDRRQPYQQEHRVRHRDGTVTWVLTRAVPQLDADGVLTGYIGTLTDIGDRKAAEHSLHQTVTRLQALMDNLPGIAYRRRHHTPGDSRVVYVSKGFEHLFGMPPETRMYGSLDERLANLWHPDDHDRIVAFVAQATSNPGGAEVRARFRHADGSIRWFLARERPVGREGEAVVSEGLLLDITDEMLTRRRLEDSERRYRQLVDTLPVGVFEAGMDGGPDLLNGPATAILGGAPDQAAALCDELRGSAADGGVTSRETCLARGDGGTLWVLTHAAPRRDADGGVTGIIGSVIDITARKAAEQTQQETLTRLQAIMDNLPGIAYRRLHAGDDSRIVFVSSNYGRLTGASPDGRAIGTSFQHRLGTIWHPDDADKVIAFREAVAAGAQDAELRARNLRADGSVGWLMARERIVGRDGDILIGEGLLLDITDEMVAQQRLAESERHYRRLVESLPVGVFEAGIDDRLEFVNGRAAGICGQMADELLGRSWADSFAPIGDTPPGDGEPVHPVDAYRRETRLVRPDGSAVWVLIQAEPRHDADGAVTGVFGSVVDITDRKAAEDAQQDTLTRLQAILDNLPGIAYRRVTTPTDSRLVFISNGFQRLFGYQPEHQIYGRSFDERLGSIWHPDDRDVIVDFVRRASTDPDGAEGRGRFINADGTVGWLLARERIVGRDGDAVIGEGLLLDITDEMVAREKLETSERRYRKLVNTLPVGLYTTDVEGRVTLFNEAMAAIWSRRPERGDYARWPDQRLLWPDGSPTPLAATPMEQARRNDIEVRDVPLLYERRDGSRVMVLVSATPLHDGDGAVVGMVSVVTDFTEVALMRKALAESERRYHDLVEAVPVGVFEANVDGQLEFVNSRAAEICGRPVTTLVGRAWTDGFVASDAAGFLTELQMSAVRGEVHSRETRLVRDSGATVWVLTHAVPRRDSGGAITGFFGSVVDITARKAAEAALERSEARAREAAQFYETLLRTMAEGLVVEDDQGNVIYSNRAAEALQPSLTASSATRDGQARFIHEDGSPFPADDHPIADTLRTGRSHRNVIMGVATDTAAPRWISVNSDIVETQDGRPSRVLATLTDITAEIAARQALEGREAELREATQRLAAMIDNLPGTVFRLRVEADGSKRMLSRRGSTVASQEDIGMPPEAFRHQFHPDDWPALFDEVPRRLREHGYVEHRFRRLLPDNQVRWLLARERVVDHDGDAIITEGLTIDITAEMQAKQALEAACDALIKSQRHFEDLVTATPNGVMMCDPQGTCTFVNDGLVEMTGMARAALLGAGWKKAIHPDNRAAVVEAWRQAVHSGGAFRQEFRIRRPDGSDVWALGHVVPRFDATDVLTGFIGSITDLTERQEREEERRRLDDRLRETHKLEALGQLAGGIAHDFNNLLGAILGFAGFISEDAEGDPSIRYHAGRILAAGRQGKAMVEQILAFARMEPPLSTAFAPARLIDDTVALLRAILPSTLHLTVDVRCGDAAVMGNSDRLGQVVLNLCINAHDALEGRPGEVTLELDATDTGNEACRRLALRGEHEAAVLTVWSDDDDTAHAILGTIDPDQPHVSLVVSDTGIGMDTDLLSRAFTPLFTTKSKGHGTGLGLSVTQRVVLAHHGALTVRTRRGAGTRVEVILPRSAAPLPVQGLAAAPAAAAATSGRVLLVDDDPFFGDMLLTALERHGFEVAPCENAHEALEAFRDDPEVFDLVLTDQTMPHMRGTDLVRLIKQIRPDIPCVLCTGYAESMMVELDLREAGLFAMLRKPVDIAMVVETLERALREARMAETAKG